MRAARVVGLCLVALAVLLLVAALLAFNSSVQTWAARRALATRPELNATLGSVSAGFQRVEIRGLRAVSDGAVLTLPSLDVDLPVVKAGLSQQVLIKSLVARGWTLDLTHAKSLTESVAKGTKAQVARSGSSREFSLIPTAQAADAVAVPSANSNFRGVFADLHLPVDLSLDGVELEGDVILPDSVGKGSSRIRVVIRGGGLAAGREGSFAIDAGATKPDGGSLAIQGTIKAAMDTPRSFDRLGLVADAKAKGPELPQGASLTINITVSRNPAGESYALLLVGAAKQLADIRADLVSVKSQIAGTWKLDVHDTDLAPFALGPTLPTFEATGSGNFETGTTFKEIHASGQLDASASRLEVLKPELSAVGTMKVKADFDVLQHANSIRVERLNGTVNGAAPLATVRSLQSFEFNFGTGELRVADPAQDLVGISLTGLPIGWARPFTGEIEVTGGDLRGEFVASAREGGLALRAKTPLTAAGVNVANAGKPMLAQVDIALDASADYTPAGWQAQVVSLTAKSKGQTLLSMNAKAGRLSGKDAETKATGSWNADLPAWSGQPLAAGQFQLSAGTARGDFSASAGVATAIESKLLVTGLVAVGKKALPAITAEVRAGKTAAGLTTFTAPILFELEGRKSDLLLAGTMTSTPAGSTIDARLSSERVVIEDVKLLALLIPPGDPKQSKRKEGPDTEPFWGKLSGQVTLALKKVIYGGTAEVSDVGGTFRLEPSALKLDNVRAVFGPESDMKLGAGLSFDPKAKQPYALAGDLAVTNFDTKIAFQALDPAKLPTVDAKVNLNSKFSGSGANLMDVAERSRGDVQVTAKSGIFRALSADMTDKVQKTQTTVAAIGGLLGAVTGKKEYADYANKTQILTDIAKALSEIPFDQLNVTASRGTDLNMVLKDFTLISPEVRLTGAGGIKYSEGLSVLAQPLALQLSLGARGQLADLLKRAGLLDTKQDALGYAAFSVPIKVGGTLAKTDTSELRKALLNSALEKTGLLDSILGK
ncbi:MAG: hypothetical protein ABIV50_04380 [Opitutus sp.]